MSYIILIEGQQIPVPDEIGSNDANVKAALAPYFPDAANAMITRTTKDNVTTVNVIKQAGKKGVDPLEHLQACPGGKNPAIALYENLLGRQDQLTVEDLLGLEAKIEKAIESGLAQANQIEAARKRLDAASAAPAPFVPLSF